MEFRRVEVRRICRHVERIAASEDVRGVFEALSAHNLKFSMRIRGIGAMQDQCVVLELRDDGLDVMARLPSKCRHTNLSYDDVETVEVVCNRGIMAEETDDGGRWARLI